MGVPQNACRYYGLFAQSDFGPDPSNFRFVLRAEYGVGQLDGDFLDRALARFSLAKAIWGQAANSGHLPGEL